VEHLRSQNALLGPGKQFSYRGLKSLALKVLRANLQIRRELHENLAAGPARCHWLDGIGDHSDGFKVSFSRSHGGEYSCPFCANGQTKGQILYVASTKNPAAARP
jgi:hypothetical protein